MNYSTEKIKVGTWTDGKPLYLIVVTKTIVNGTTKLLDKVDTLVDASIVLIDNTNKRQYAAYDYLPMVTKNETKLGVYNGTGDSGDGVFFECNASYGGANNNLTSGGWSVRSVILYTELTD